MFENLLLKEVESRFSNDFFNSIKVPINSGSLSYSYALSVDDFSTVLLVLFLGDPLGFEGGEGRKGGTTGPDGVVSILGGDDLDHTSVWAHGVELLLESIWESLVESGSSGEDDVGVKVLSNINVTFLDGTEAHLVHTLNLVTLLDQFWEEQTFWSQESWGVDGNSLTIWKFVHLLELGGLGSLGLISGWVE